MQRFVSDELTHFVGFAAQGRVLKGEISVAEGLDLQYRILNTILECGYLSYPPHERTTSAKIEINNLKEPSPDRLLNSSCVCFCDIPLADLPFHMRRYGPFGLAFSKTFLLQQGASPVFYVPADAPSVINPKQARKDRLKEMFRATKRLISQVSKAKAGGDAQSVDNKTLFEVTQFWFFDVFSAMKIFDADVAAEAETNYYMEREWRLMRNLQFQLADVRRVIIPHSYADRFYGDFPQYRGQVNFAPGANKD